MSFSAPPSPLAGDGLLPHMPNRSRAPSPSGRRSPATADPLGATSRPPSPPAGGESLSAPSSAPSMSRDPSRKTIMFDGNSPLPSPRVSTDLRRPMLSRAGSEATLYLGDDGSLMSKTPSSSMVKLTDMPRRPPLSRATTGRTLAEDVEDVEDGLPKDKYSSPPSSSASSLRGTEGYARPPLSRGNTERTLTFAEPTVSQKYGDRPPLGPRGWSNLSKLSTGNLDSAFDENEDEHEDHVSIHGDHYGQDNVYALSSVRRRSSKHDAPSGPDDWAYEGHSKHSELSQVGERTPRGRWNFAQRFVEFFEPVTFHPQEFHSAQEMIRTKSEMSREMSSGVNSLDYDHPAPSTPTSGQASGVDSFGKSEGEFDSKTSQQAQGRPILLPSLTAELLFVLVCSSGQFIFQSLLGSITILQRELVDNTFKMSPSQAPWLTGSFLLANGLSVTISGALADIYGPRSVITSSLAFLTIVNVVGAALGRDTHGTIAFLFIRAFQGLATGGLTSSTISYLGRIYRSGQRKNRIFSSMGAQAPIGYFIGGIQGGALAKRIDWWFGSNAIACFLIFALAWKYSPTENALRQYEAITQGLTVDALIEKDKHEPKRRFDYIGSLVAVAGCGLVIFGLTQGSSANWSPYTWGTLLGGFVLLALFPYVESKVEHPLVPNDLWKVKGFGYVILTYGLSFGAFTAYQFYVCQFWLWIQGRSALIVALYFVPASTVGVVATFFVARLFHMLPGHWLMGAGCLSSAIAPAMFIANKPWTTYWALGMPAIAIGTLSPDLSFASASIFITSAVSRKYQGVAGSMLLTVQSLSGSAGTAFTETVADQVKEKGYRVLSLTPDIQNVGAVGTTWMGPGHHLLHGEGTMLASLHAAWWFNLAASLAAFFIAILLLRIPKADEQDHQE